MPIYNNPNLDQPPPTPTYYVWHAWARSVLHVTVSYSTVESCTTRSERNQLVKRHMSVTDALIFLIKFWCTYVSASYSTWEVENVSERQMALHRTAPPKFTSLAQEWKPGLPFQGVVRRGRKYKYGKSCLPFMKIKYLGANSNFAPNAESQFPPSDSGFNCLACRGACKYYAQHWNGVDQPFKRLQQ